MDSASRRVAGIEEKIGVEFMKRIYHHYKKWECVKAGMYKISKIDSEAAKNKYAKFLSNKKKFGAALDRVLSKWPISCEQFLSNSGINRIAWLGQASLCISAGIPCFFRGGFNRLSKQKQKIANNLALKALKKWQTKYTKK